MRRRMSKFERRILLAVLLSGLVPFLVWVGVGFKLLLEPPLVLHENVEEQFKTARLFYRQFIDAKKSEFSARADWIARDPILRDAMKRASDTDAKDRLEAIVSDYDSIRRIGIYGPDGALIVSAEGPQDRMSDEFAARTWKVPLGLGTAPEDVRISFLLPADYQTKRDALQQFYEVYRLALGAGRREQIDNMVRFAIITTLILLVALGIGYTLARRVTKRINRMADATKRVAAGDLDIQIPLRGDDEITELTAAFNKMVAEVAAARDRIVYLEKVSGWQDLARRLAHEIKNPLTPIQLAVQELERRTPADADADYKRLVADSIDVVREEIGALTRLVDEFSQFARLPEVSPETVELGTFVQEYLDAYNRHAPDAEVEVTFPDEPIQVGLDRVLFRQVLANLASNAIEAAGAGHARLHFEARILSGSREVELSIVDNGPGVPAANQTRIFEPYFTTKSTGTGLGLAMVKKIVLQHEGTIALDSPAGGGTAFVIRLPLRDIG